MGRKNRKKAIKRHEQHHQALHEHAMQDIPHDQHRMYPVGYMGHVPEAWCYCVPIIEDEDPRTLKRIYRHRYIIH